MPNIAIIDYCNLKCPYCFASTMINEGCKTGISIDQFQKILNWLKKTPKLAKSIGIIGGEPTLHPQFKTILKMVKDYSNEVQGSSVLFTNGIYLNQFITDIPTSMRILLNFNSPTTMSLNYYQQIIDNIELLHKLGWLSTIHNEVNKATLGCNLCMEIDDYTYFWDIVKKYQIKEVRMSVTAPIKEEYKHNKQLYYSQMKEKALAFFKQADSYNTSISLDCNQIPICFFNSEEIKIIDKVTKYTFSKSLLCKPVIDITQDFKASSCFGVYELVDCNNFNTLQDLKEFFLYRKIVPFMLENTDGACASCERHALVQCQGGCLAFSKLNTV